jgi:GAF domain-containing protein
MAVTNGSAATPAREKLIGETFVEMADTLVAEFDVIDFLHGLVSRTVELLDVNAAGIMLSDQRGGLTVMASSSEEARLLELYELQNDEGPCLDCFRSGLPVVYDDVPAMRAAWPEFTPWLLQFGFSSAQAIPMRLRSETIGALNIFRTGPGPLPEADLRLAQAMADVATIGLMQERALAARELLAEQLQTALNSRILIEQAKGVLAERTGRPMDQAFDVMRAHARNNGRRLAEVAAQLIDGTLTKL